MTEEEQEEEGSRLKPHRSSHPIHPAPKFLRSLDKMEKNEEVEVNLVVNGTGCENGTGTGPLLSLPSQSAFGDFCLRCFVTYVLHPRDTSLFSNVP